LSKKNEIYRVKVIRFGQNRNFVSQKLFYPQPLSWASATEAGLFTVSGLIFSILFATGVRYFHSLTNKYLNWIAGRTLALSQVNVLCCG